MNNLSLKPGRHTVGPELRAVEQVGNSSIIEGLGGVGAMTLAVLASIGVAPTQLASIAVVLAGCALLIGGGTLASHYNRIFGVGRRPLTREVIESGIGMESVAGVVAGAIGLLALLGVYPTYLLGIAVIILGSALLLASRAMARLTSAPIEEFFGADHARYPTQMRERARAALHTASHSEAIIGAGAIVLGILALSGFAPHFFLLLALFAIGASILHAGSVVAGILSADVTK
jgi:hypothetical protein